MWSFWNKFFDRFRQSTEKKKAKVIAGRKYAKFSRNVKEQLKILKSYVSLWYFATKRTVEIFVCLNISDSFLQISPEEWKDNINYKNAWHCVKELRVWNSTVETTVQLIQEYKKLLTKEVDDKQYLLHVIDANKKTITT